ncbi:Rrf2 family transcriptional regulator [Synechococcus sp. GFB01]|uniref:RrF2 family transcriptional regulator n=1 Tax=Synechococcus sp. GFB01 TaxID=1662190 RepID=UPI0013792FD1|nr:Rrf2 family transcriptional regulator [Synechococcus sp. GFB01]
MALLDLAAAHVSGGLLQTREISRNHGIPERYLEQMLTALRKGGFLKSVRGPHGGFQLTRSPEQISIAEVETCLEGESTSEHQATGRTQAFWP